MVNNIVSPWQDILAMTLYILTYIFMFGAGYITGNIREQLRKKRDFHVEMCRNCTLRKNDG